MGIYKEVFKFLKEECRINSVFNEFDRQLVLDISSDRTPPKVSTEISSEFDEIEKRGKTFADSLPLDEVKHFIQDLVSVGKKYRHHTISVPQYKTMIEYFVVSECVRNEDSLVKSVLSEDEQAKTLILSHPSVMNPEDGWVYAVMVVFEDWDNVTDDNFGKIVRHELTHVILEVIDCIMGAEIFTDSSTGEPLIADKREQREFEEFLCDYIQCDSTVGPTSDPVEVFNDVIKNHLTWIAGDLYRPYLNDVSDYYLSIGSGGEKDDAD